MLADRSAFYGFPQPIDMLDEASVRRLIAAIKEKTRDPRLICLDTLARNFGPGDENSAKDMGRFVAACDRPRAEFPNATVVVVHHCGWERVHERGSTALRGAIDTLLGVAGKDGKIALTVEKQKDFERDRRPIWLELVDVLETQSAVVGLAEPPEPKPKIGTENENKVMQALAVAPEGLPTSWLANQTGINRNTLKGVMVRLEQQGRVRKEGRQWVALAQEAAE